MGQQRDRLLGAEEEGEVDGAADLSVKKQASDATSRLVVLALYSAITANQSLLWMTWSSVPDISRDYLGVTDTTLDLWLDWGPIAFILSVFIASHLLSVRRDGLQLSMRIAACLCFCAAVVRCVPILLSDDDIQGSAVVSNVIGVAQFLNGAAAPFVVASPSVLSMLWFPEEQRNGATAVANVANALGRGVGFFLGPALVRSTSDVPTLLLVEVGLTLLPLVLVYTVLPAGPATPPSKAAEREAQAWQEAEDRKVALALDDEEGGGKGGGDAASSLAVLAQVKTAVYTPSFLLLCVSGGLQMAIYGAWSGVLPSVLTNGTGLYTDAQAGTFGSINTFAGIVGGLAAGVLTDVKALRTRLIPVVAGLLLASTVCFGLVSAALPPLQLTPLATLTGSYPGLLALCGLAGLLRGGTDPLFFELSAEAVADRGVSAGTAGSALTFWYHLVLCLLLSVPPAPLQAAAMPAMALCLLLSAALLLPVKVAYTRR